MVFGLWQAKLSYTCACCNKVYEGSPSLAYFKPSYYFDVPEDELEARVMINSDLCHIKAPLGQDSDNDIYAIRCTLDVPIHGVKEPFCWGLWVTQSQQSFDRYVETCNSDQSKEVSFGWLTVTMPYYNRSKADEHLENLACDVRWRRKGQRPKIVLHETDHPLYRDQNQGIDWKTAITIAQSFLKVAHDKADDT